MDLETIENGISSYFGLRFDFISFLMVHLPSYAFIVAKILSDNDRSTSPVLIKLIIYTLVAPKISETIRAMQKSASEILSSFGPLSKCYLLDNIKVPKDYKYFEEDKAEHVYGDLSRIKRQVEYEASNFKETYIQEIQSIELSNI